MNFHRSQRHLQWCWMLLVVREMIIQDGRSNELAIFIRFVLDRVDIITNEHKMPNDWNSPGHLEELGLAASIICSLVVTGGQFETGRGKFDLVPISLKLFSVMASCCMCEQLQVSSVLEEQLAK